MTTVRSNRLWRRSPLSRRRLLASAGATGVVTVDALLTGCAGSGAHSSTRTGGQTGSPAAKRGGALTAFTTAPSEDLEPHGARSNAAASQTLFTLIHSGLLRLKLGDQYKFADRTMEGVLASGWEQPDNQTFVFHLRPGVKFQDKPPVNGRALTSTDVKFTFDRLVSGPFAYASFYTSIASIEAPDSQTVTMHMKAPDATFLSHLALGFAWIIPREAGVTDSKGAAGLSFKAPSTAIGAGPFMLDHYDTAVGATFIRNPNYFEPGLPYLDSVKYLFLSSDPATQLAALQTGQAAIGSLPAGSEADFKSRNPKLVSSEEYSTQAWHHGMRVDHTPFSDVRVRHALAMAYSQDEVKQIWGTPDAPSSYGSLTAVAGDGYLPADQLGDDAKWWKFDPTAAKQLLAAAGFPNGFATDYNDSDCCGATHLPEQIAADLAKIGVKVTVKVKAHPAYQASTARGDYEGIAGTGVQVYDPDDWFSAVLLPGTARNISHTDDPLVNDLTAKQRAELDPKKRLDIVHQLVRYLAGQAYQLVEPQNIITHVQQPVVRNYALRVGYQPSLTVTWLDT